MLSTSELLSSERSPPVLRSPPPTCTDPRSGTDDGAQRHRRCPPVRCRGRPPDQATPGLGAGRRSLSRAPGPLDRRAGSRGPAPRPPGSRSHRGSSRRLQRSRPPRPLRDRYPDALLRLSTVPSEGRDGGAGGAAEEALGWLICFTSQPTPQASRSWTSPRPRIPGGSPLRYLRATRWLQRRLGRRRGRGGPDLRRRHGDRAVDLRAGVMSSKPWA